MPLISLFRDAAMQLAQCLNTDGDTTLSVAVCLALSLTVAFDFRAMRVMSVGTDCICL